MFISSNVMKFYNLQAAYDYLDGLEDDSEHGAALVVHMAWLEYCSSPRADGGPAAEIDLLLLYRASVAAFGGRDGAAGRIDEQNDNITEFNRFNNLLSSPSDEAYYPLVRRFAGEFAASSRLARGGQDLRLALELFIGAVRRCRIEDVVSGEVSRTSRRLVDPDRW